MRYSSEASVTISAGHTPDANEWCGAHHHGHRYTVTVTFDREGYPATDHAAWVPVRTKLLDLAMELKNRSLNDMLGAQVPNVFGVASFFMERLAINVPVTQVKVSEDDGPVAIIERSTDY